MRGQITFIVKYGGFYDMCHEAYGKERVYLTVKKSVKEFQNFAALTSVLFNAPLIFHA